MALMIGCIWHGLDALQGTRAKPGNHLVIYIILEGARASTGFKTYRCYVWMYDISTGVMICPYAPK